MITYLKGILAYKGEMLTVGTCLVVEVQGIGYQVLTSERSLMNAPGLLEPIVVYTSLIVREDAMQLVGFLSKEERELFDILSTASGVGPKVALSLMSALSVAEIAAALMASDFKRLTVAKGVGPKLAQKMTIELKEKLTKWRDSHIETMDFAPSSQPLPQTHAFEEAETVLLSLGYNLQEIYPGFQHLQKTAENVTKLSSEEILQQTLKWLATHPVS